MLIFLAKLACFLVFGIMLVFLFAGISNIVRDYQKYGWK